MVTAYDEPDIPESNEDLDQQDRKDRRTKWLIILGLAVAVLLGALLALASDRSQRDATNSESQKLSLAQQVAAACARPDVNDATLKPLCDNADRIIDQGASQGKQGPPGIPGLRGEQGPPGLDGINGKDGRDGTDGRNGMDGTDGPPGDNGKAGTNGADGSNGTNGLNGADGQPGPPGADGQPGPPGKDGTNGTDGAKGDPGDPAYPFTFTFTVPDYGIPPEDRTYECTIIQPDEPVTCQLMQQGGTK